MYHSKLFLLHVVEFNKTTNVSLDVKTSISFNFFCLDHCLCHGLTAHSLLVVLFRMHVVQRHSHLRLCCSAHQHHLQSNQTHSTGGDEGRPH